MRPPALRPLARPLLGLLVLGCFEDGESVPARPPEPAAEAPAEPAAAETGSTEPAPAPAAPDSPERTPRRMRHVSPDGEVFEAEFTEEGELPADFPDDVPIYENATPQQGMAAVGGGMVVNLRTGDPSDRVFEFYLESMLEQGWEVEAERSHRGQHMLTLRKGNRIAGVSIASSDSFTQIMLSVGEDR